MYDVNWEKGSGVCRGCLSSERRLSPLVHSELYATLLNKNQKDMDTSVVVFCWECAALMRRMYRFQLQTRKADKMLSESLETFLIKKSLSNLIISRKQDYDTIVKESDVTSDQLDIFDIEIKDEPLKDENSSVGIIEENDSDGEGRFDEINASSDEENTKNAENTSIKTINEQHSRKRKHEVDTIEFVGASVPTKRRSERIKNVIDKPNPKALKKPKLKTVKCKNKQKAKAIPVNIKIKNEIDIDLSKSVPCLSVVQEAVAENSNKNEFDEKSNITQETDNPYVNTDTIPDIDLKSESSVSDSNKEDLDYFEEENGKEVKKALKTDKYKNRYKKKHALLIKRDIIRYTCDQLDEYFSEVQVADGTIEELLKSEPKYTTEERPCGCQYCGMCFEITRQLYQHQRTRHKQIRKAMLIKDSNSPLYYRYSMYRCNICDQVLRKEHSEAHMKYLHRVKYTCTECDAIFWARSDVDQHCRSSHTTFSCKLCNAVRTSKRLLDNHTKKWHTPESCEDCGEEFPSWKRLCKHREVKHPETSPELRYCVQCNIQYRTVFAYKAHLKRANIHRTEPPKKFPCSECSAVLTSEYSLKCHRDKFHREETRFQCPHCGKFLARACGLRLHIASAHLKVPKPKNRICSYCGRAFGDKRILIHHIRTHTGERPYQCGHCPAAFAQPYPLKKHLATVHKHATDTVQDNTTDPQVLQNDSNSLT